MQGSINFDGSLVGNITGGGGGGGDTVVITPVVTSGTKIADVSVNGVEKDLYCPNPPEIDITPVVTSGTKIADVSVGGVEKDLYTPNPTQVSVNQVQQSGTKIATIGVNGVNTDIYAPQGGCTVYSGGGIPQINLGVNGDIYAKVSGAETDTDILLTDIVVNQNNIYMPFTIDLGEASALVIETTWGTFVKNIADIPPFADTPETKNNIWEQSTYYSCGVSRSGDTFYFYVQTPSGNTNQYIQSVSKRIITIEPSSVDSLYFKLSNKWIEYNPS